MEDLSIDEVTTKIEDAYDASVAPKKLLRVDDNKLHLISKAMGAGFTWLNKSVLSLKQRFNPLLCDDDDLPVTAAIIGTAYKSGKASVVAITAVNTNSSTSASLLAGSYLYESSSGEIFSFELAADILFDPSESKLYHASSQNIGSFPVSDISSASIVRDDAAPIGEDFAFSCEDNAGLLGYPAETDLEFRKRISTDTGRDDDINEIENKIGALAGIFECNCVFNSLNTSKVYDGIALGAKELLIIITGVPTSDIAKIVAKHSHYATHMVDEDLVVLYESALYIDGVYPVYYKFHDNVEYTLRVEYNYDSKKIKYQQVEAGLNVLLAQFMTTVRHVDIVSEQDMYARLAEQTLASVNILNVTMFVDAAEVPYVTIPRTRLPKLVGPVVFVKTDVSA